LSASANAPKDWVASKVESKVAQNAGIDLREKRVLLNFINSVSLI
jgi:hypothetical protein